MEMFISPAGSIRAIYGEEIPLESFGPLQIRRASHVDADSDGQWWADLSPSGGPKLGPFGLRSAALRAEFCWLMAHITEGG